MHKSLEPLVIIQPPNFRHNRECESLRWSAIVIEQLRGPECVLDSFSEVVSCFVSPWAIHNDQQIIVG